MRLFGRRREGSRTHRSGSGSGQSDSVNPLIDLFQRPELMKVYHRGVPVCVNIEINQRCGGGCRYCYASSTAADELPADNLSLLKFNEILTLRRLGTRVVYLYGGDQLLHPRLEDMIRSAVEHGFHIVLPLAGLITASNAAMLVEAYRRAQAHDRELFVGIHLDTLDRSVYHRVNNRPETLEAKMAGYRRLLQAGFPADHTFGCPTLTSQSAATIVPLMDWFYSIGARHIALVPFRPLGLAAGAESNARWEPTLTQLERAFRYRASVEGANMLMVGSSDGRYACQGHIAVTATGDVVPCLLLQDLVQGNIYEEPILEIYHRAKDALQFQFPVKGPCAQCVSEDVCCGCRANAHIYCGDITASDPKCFFNPNAPERCL